MSESLFKQYVRSIAENSLTPSDKIFILENSFHTLELAGNECLTVPQSHVDQLVNEVSANACGRARKRQCETITSQLTDTLIGLKNHVLYAMEGILGDAKATNEKRKDVVWMSPSDYGHGIRVEIYSNDVETIEKFKFLCLKNIPKEMTPFHMVNHSYHQLFDVWNPNVTWLVNTIAEICSEIIVPLECPLESFTDVIEISSIENTEYTPFDESLHCFDDFERY